MCSFKAGQQPFCALELQGGTLYWYWYWFYGGCLGIADHPYHQPLVLSRHTRFLFVVLLCCGASNTVHQLGHGRLLHQLGGQLLPRVVHVVRDAFQGCVPTEPKKSSSHSLVGDSGCYRRCGRWSLVEQLVQCFLSTADVKKTGSTRFVPHKWAMNAAARAANAVTFACLCCCGVVAGTAGTAAAAFFLSHWLRLLQAALV